MADKSPDPGAKCTIAGWGTQVAFPKNYNYTNEAKVSIVTVQDWKNCSATRTLLPEGAICYTTPEYGGSCNGDEGGPLIYDGRLVGILMPMKICDASNTSEFAIDIFSHLNWINENVYRTPEVMAGASAVLLLNLLMVLTALLVTPEFVDIMLLLDTGSVIEEVPGFY